MEYENILFTTDGAIAFVSLNRPNFLNAINTAVLEELDDALQRVKEDDSVRALVIRGEGRAFCAGWDLKENASESNNDGVNPLEWLRRFQRESVTFERIWNLPKPVVASIHGYCLGVALKLVLHCDFAIVAENAKFGLPEVRQASGVGLGELLYSIGSLKKLKEIMMLGAFFGAHEAELLGLVNEVVEVEKLVAATHDLARRLSLIPPTAMAMVKKYINDETEARGLFQSVKYEQVLSAMLTTSEDFLEFERLQKTLGPEKLREFFKQRDEDFKKRV